MVADKLSSSSASTAENCHINTHTRSIMDVRVLRDDKARPAAITTSAGGACASWKWADSPSLCITYVSYKLRVVD